MPIFCLVSSACILTPSSKFRLNRSRQATTTVSLSCSFVISSFHAGRDMELPVISSARMCSSRIPNSELEDMELCLQVPGGVVVLGDPGIAVCDGGPFVISVVVRTKIS